MLTLVAVGPAGASPADDNRFHPIAVGLSSSQTKRSVGGLADGRQPLCRHRGNVRLVQQGSGRDLDTAVKFIGSELGVPGLDTCQRCGDAAATCMPAATRACTDGTRRSSAGPTCLRRWMADRSGPLRSRRTTHACCLQPAGRRPLYRSDDAGTTWRQLEIPFADSCIQVLVPRPTQILFDPIEQNTIWLGVEVDALYRSTDGGTTWTRHDKGMNRSTSTALLWSVGARCRQSHDLRDDRPRSAAQPRQR